ncbi:MAG: fumarylacetoacetate hydrolase family protein [Candidatus Schekmanbacteria bacterium]|nr:fumarylacetoacetate hydrolase family protein [Candidatus Schekmanbacteria bacterium]
MRIVRFRDDTGTSRWGQRQEEDWVEALASAIQDGEPPVGSGVRLRSPRFLAPVVPAAVLCIGVNYRAHAAETGRPVPERPVLFMKNPAAVQDPDGPIVIPGCCADPPQVDFEGELAVVIGRRAKNVSAPMALEHVLGYTIGNDVSARRWQRDAGGGQWVRGKSFDTFCPLGPDLVTPEEVADPQSLTLTTRVNGEVMQQTTTGDMIFSVAELIAYLSQGTTLLPGTVILTGTPSGVGVARTPPRFLAPGDVVEVEISSLGILRNPVVGADRGQ